MWTYMLGKFVNDAYAGEWYNGQVEQTPEYVGNKVSMLIGMPRLRQLRIKEGKVLSFCPRPLMNQAGARRYWILSVSSSQTPSRISMYVPLRYYLNGPLFQLRFLPSRRGG